MRVSYDNGQGSMCGRWLSIHVGRGSGYLREWWTNLNAGPGLAVTPYTACGHRGLSHCNSAYCTRAWCNAQSWPVFGWLFVRSHTLRIWVGPTYRGLTQWRMTLSYLASQRRTHRRGYSLVEFT
jgi:hypothetical protein